MEIIEIEQVISNYFSENNIVIVDALGKRYKITSYEDYKYQFTLIKSTYQDTIIEYSEEGKNYLSKLSEFIDTIQSETTNENLEQYIKTNTKTKLQINYSGEINLKSIYPKSFSIQREASQEAFENIYAELGYTALIKYIQLVKSPSNFSTYLNSSDDRQLVAMKFMLFKTNHHSSKKLTRDLSAKNIFEMNTGHIQESFSAITKEKEEFINFMNEHKEKYDNWFANTDKQINEFEQNHSNKLVDIEKTYEAKLKVEEPAKFMKDQAFKYFISSILWSLAIIGLAIFLMYLLAILISPEVTFNDKVITINVLNNDMPVYNSIILLGLISLVLYVLRIFIKMAISSKHLMEEYKQKYALTYFYLSLVNNGSLDDEKSQNIILTSLFTKADTGLIKNDNSNDIDKTILSLLSK